MFIRKFDVNLQFCFIFYSRISEFSNYATIYYINTLTRAPPFFVGMVYGYLLHLCKNKQLKIAKVSVLFANVLI